MSQPLFTKSSLDSMNEVFFEKAQIVCRILDKHAKSKEPIDVQALFMKYTLDSFGVVGFGGEIGCLEKEVEFPVHFDAAQKILNEFFFNPMTRNSKTV